MKIEILIDTIVSIKIYAKIRAAVDKKILMKMIDVMPYSKVFGKMTDQNFLKTISNRPLGSC